MTEAITGYGWLTPPYGIYSDAFTVDFMAGHIDGIDSFSISATSNDQTTEVAITAPTDRSYVQIGTNYDGTAIYENVYRVTVSAANLAALPDGICSLRLTITHNTSLKTTLLDDWVFYNNDGTTYTIPAAEATVYIKPTTGSDANSGLTSGLAVKTLQRAFTVAAGGATGDLGGATIICDEAGDMTWPKMSGIQGTETYLAIQAGAGLDSDDCKITRKLGECPGIEFTKFKQIQFYDVQLRNRVMWLDRCESKRSSTNYPPNQPWLDYSTTGRQYSTGTKFTDGSAGPIMPKIVVGGSVSGVDGDVMNPWRQSHCSVVCCTMQTDSPPGTHSDVHQWGGDAATGRNIMLVGNRDFNALGAHFFRGIGQQTVTESTWVENCVIHQTPGPNQTGTNKYFRSRFGDGLRNFVMRNCTWVNQSFGLTITDPPNLTAYPIADVEISNCLLANVRAEFPSSQLNQTPSATATMNQNVVFRNNIFDLASVFNAAHSSNRRDSLTYINGSNQTIQQNPNISDFRLGPQNAGYLEGKAYDYSLHAGQVNNATTPNIGAHWSAAEGDYTQHVTYSTA